MSYDHYWGVLVLLAILAGLAYSLWRRILEQRHERRLHELAHTESMAAIERGEAMPEVLELRAEALAAPPEWSPPVDRSRAFLAIGTLSITLGLGFSLAFYLIEDPNQHAAWPIGLIPLLLGVGFLLVARQYRA